MATRAPVDEYPIEVDALYGCWLWTGRKDREGYARTGRPPQLAHRVLYVDLVGEIPPGMELEHCCRRRHCVRPSHRSVVTGAENRRLKAWRNRSQMRECSGGHNLRRFGLHTPEGGWVCRKCNRDLCR